MGTTILSVIGGLLVLLLGYQLKKLDDLTVSFHRDFLGLTKDVGALSTKVGLLDTKVEVLDTKVEVLDSKVGDLRDEVGGLRDDMARMTTRVDGMDERLRALQGTVEHLSARFDEHLASAHGR